VSALPVVAPSEETRQRIERWITDLLIAGLAHDIDALVWSLDTDFEG